jgi:hypothetical protein
MACANFGEARNTGPALASRMFKQLKRQDLPSWQIRLRQQMPLQAPPSWTAYKVRGRPRRHRAARRHVCVRGAVLISWRSERVSAVISVHVKLHVLTRNSATHGNRRSCSATAVCSHCLVLFLRVEGTVALRQQCTLAGGAASTRAAGVWRPCRAGQ